MPSPNKEFPKLAVSEGTAVESFTQAYTAVTGSIPSKSPKRPRTTTIRRDTETGELFPQAATAPEIDWTLPDVNPAQASRAGQNKRFIRSSAPSSNERTDPDMTDFSAKDYIDSRLEAAAARTDGEFVKVLAKLDIISATMTTRWTTWSAALTIMGIILASLAAFLAYGGDRFDGGVQLTASSIQYAIDAQKTAAENSKQIEAIAEAIKKRDTQIDSMFEMLKKQNESAPQ